MLHLTRRQARGATWAAIVLCAAAIRAPAGPADQSTARPEPATGSIAAYSDWRFHAGDDRAWADPDFDDSAWETLSAERSWGEQGHAGYHGFAWYRRAISPTPGNPQSADYALLVPEVGQAYEVYWNGSLVGGWGSLPPNPVWFADQGPHVFPLAGSPRGVVALRVWNAPPLSDEDPGQSGGLAGAPLVGTDQAIADARDALDYQWLRSRQILLAQNLLYALVALLSLLAWMRNREQWALFWMAGFTLPSVLILILLRSRLPVPYTVSMGLGQPIDSVRDISLWFLLLWLLGLHEDALLRRATRWMAVLILAVNALDGLFVALAWHPELLRTAQLGDAIITILNTLAQLYPLVLVFVAVGRRRRMQPAPLALSASALLVEMVTVIRDASAQGQRFTHWSLRPAIDGPWITLGGSTISPMNVLHFVLFLSIVYAVFSSFLEQRRREMIIEQELGHARELQRLLIPATPLTLSGLRVMSAYHPSQEVGGDFFQVLGIQEAESEPVEVVIGDVSGKGLAAAMSVSFLVGAIRALNRPEYGPAQLLQRLNTALLGRLAGGFATCLVLRLEPCGRCTVASAGHPGPFVDGQELDMQGALPLGIMDAPAYTETAFTLGPGQVCALYTDGLLEARNRAGEIYGFRRLERLFAARPTAEEAAQAAVAFGQSDDVTVVIVARGASAVLPQAAAVVRSDLPAPAA